MAKLHKKWFVFHFFLKQLYPPQVLWQVLFIFFAFYFHSVSLKLQIYFN